MLDAAAFAAPGPLAFIRAGDVWVHDFAMGRTARLTTDGRNHSPKWSPTGEWLAFLREGQAWVMRADGSAPAFLADTGDWNATLTWSPDGEAVAVESAAIFRREPGPVWKKQASGVSGRVVWRPEGQEWIDGAMRIGTGPALVPNPPGPLIPAAWSGKEILYWAAPEVSASLLADGLQLFVVSVNGGTPRAIGGASLLYPDFVAMAPGRGKMALVAGSGRESYQDKYIAVFDFATATLRRLTPETEAAISPDWSPDGKRLTFVASHDYGPEGLAKPHRVITPNGQVRVVPPGSRVGVSFDQSQETLRGRRVWLMNSDGTGRAPLTSDAPVREERPLWSSDGREILFVRMDPSDATSLWLADTGGGLPHKIADGLSLPKAPQPATAFYGHVRWEQFFDWRR